jgi:hypothetical protein
VDIDTQYFKDHRPELTGWVFLESSRLMDRLPNRNEQDRFLGELAYLGCHTG